MRSEHRPLPETGGWPQNKAVEPVETVEVWYGGFHRFEPSVEGDNRSPCKTCEGDIGGHTHYPAYEYVVPQALLDERDTLRDGLVRYGDHRDDCKLADFVDCTCGWHEFFDKNLAPAILATLPNRNPT